MLQQLEEKKSKVNLDVLNDSTQIKNLQSLPKINITKSRHSRKCWGKSVRNESREKNLELLFGKHFVNFSDASLDDLMQTTMLDFKLIFFDDFHHEFLEL